MRSRLFRPTMSFVKALIGGLSAPFLLAPPAGAYQQEFIGDDAGALNSDWQAVGDDIRSATEKYKNGEGKRAQKPAG